MRFKGRGQTLHPTSRKSVICGAPHLWVSAGLTLLKRPHIVTALPNRKSAHA
jgi:hypothetical protein